MEKITELAIYELRIDQDDDSKVEVDFVSLVDKPAIGRQFLAFMENGFAEGMPHYTADGVLWTGPTHKDADGKLMTGATHTDESVYLYHESELKQLKKQTFAIQDEDERIISGPLMLADSPIYRNDERGEYYVMFAKDTIKQIAQKFFRKGYQNNVNLMHDDGEMLVGLTMFESFITDEKRGIRPMKAFADVPDGSWFGSFKVDNDGAWQMIKDGKVKGFSIEGVFNYKRHEAIDEKSEKLWSQIIDILKNVS